MIPLSRPSIDEREVEAVVRVMRSGWLAQGAEVAALEQEFAAYLDPEDPPFVVAVSSGTTALHLALIAARAGPTVPVIAPSYSFVASANAGLYCHAAVELCDIDINTYNLDPQTIPVRKHDRRIVIAVHQVGLPCDVDAFVGRPGETIVEDAACAIGARYRDGRRVGARHDTFACCFSLHGSKSIVAGEGGLVVTRSRHAAAEIRMLRQHGVDIAAEHRSGAEREQYMMLGFNYRMTDLQAAIARVQIAKADDIVAARRRRAAMYTEALQRDCVVPVEGPAGVQHAYQRYLIRLESLGVREIVVRELTAASISCRRGLQVIHRQPYWASAESLWRTEFVADTTVQLPLWADMTDDDLGRVVSVLKSVLKRTL
jgi:dTDP-4-amino-4,6-dideoxygalactose transaminase